MIFQKSLFQISSTHKSGFLPSTAFLTKQSHKIDEGEQSL